MIPFWPKWLDDIWAKSPRGEETSGETLAQHTYFVLQKLANMIHLRPDLPDRLGFPSLWTVLFWACWLHDVGKVAKGFQHSLRGGALWPHRHEVLSLAFIDWIADLDQKEKLWVAATITCHHKDFKPISLMYMGPEDVSAETLSLLVDEVRDSDLSGIWKWLSESSSSWIASLGLDAEINVPRLLTCEDSMHIFRSESVHCIRFMLKELARVSRGLRGAANIEVIRLLVLRGHMTSSDHTASAHAPEWPGSPLHRSYDLLGRWGMSQNDLYPHQVASMRTLGSAILVSPTGSGKTEAALLWACGQGTEEQPGPRLFYTLPYQASMNAMYDRLRGDSFPGQVGLEHGRSLLAVYRRMLEETADPRSASLLARLASRLSRLHHYPVKVFSPYQMLKGPYQLKGYEALLTDFIGATFVFDEVHAYEVGRLAAILATVNYLRQSFGARFFVMSATLPSIVMRRIQSALGSPKIIRATSNLFAAFQRHHLITHHGDLLGEEWIGRIADDARNGLSVLVCCNTVKRAQQAYEVLRQRLGCQGDVALLHSRFTYRDRLSKEKAVQEATGCRSNARRPLVLVSTQVVEVSLDVDFDTIYSDLAPLDALIQRFGRVNRRRSKPWAPVFVFSEPTDGGGIYELELLDKTLDVLQKHNNTLINEEKLSSWLDEVYGGEFADRWEGSFEDSYTQFEENCLRGLRPFESQPHLEQVFYRAFDGVEVLPACFEAEYSHLVGQGEILEAAKLMVTVSWRQFCRLKDQNKVLHRSDLVKVVNTPYSAEIGLQF
ncbi:MAG: CRISPR-associated helicase Cas3' [Bacillota bacterium]|nr:CRISPR-associated helicase Cas3' [Bacillota bacterium]